MFKNNYLQNENKEEAFEEKRNIDTIKILMCELNYFLRIFKEGVDSRSILTLDLNQVGYGLKFNISQFVANRLNITSKYDKFFKDKKFFINGNESKSKENTLNIYDLNIENDFNTPKKKFNGKIRNYHQAYKNVILPYICEVKISDFHYEHQYVAIKDIYFFYIKYIIMFLCRWINTQNIDYYTDCIEVLNIFLQKYPGIKKYSNAIDNIVSYFTSEKKETLQVYLGKEVVKGYLIDSYGFLVYNNKFVNPWIANGDNHFRYKLPKFQYLIDIRLNDKSDIEKINSSYTSARILYSSWAYKYDTKISDIIFSKGAEIHHKISPYDDRISSLEVPKNKKDHKMKEHLRLFPMNKKIINPVQDLF